MLVANLLLGVSTTIILILGLFILAGNSKRPINRALTAFLFSIAAWLLANLLTNTASDPDLALLFGRTTLIGPVLLTYTFLVFCKLFVSDKTFNKRKALAYAVLPMLLLVTLPTDLNISDIDAYGRNTVAGPVYIVLVPMILLYFTIGTGTLIRQYKRSRKKLERKQLNYIFAGIGLSLIPGVIANGILPVLGYDQALFYGPNTIMFLAIFMSLAIIKHKFLNIRLIVARSLGYIFSIGLLAIGYGVATYLLTTGLAIVAPEGTLAKVLNIGLVVVAAMSYAYVKRFFDKVTDKFFYRDAYDPQVFLEQFNQQLVSTIDIKKLLKGCATLITEHIKAEYVLFGLRETEYEPQRIIGSADKKIDTEDIRAVRAVTPFIHQTVLVADELENHVELGETLQKYDIEVLVRLTVDPTSNQEGLGYLVLGAKKSGNPYNKQDIQTLEIIANELVIAIQNGLRFEEIEKFNLTLQEKVDDATKQLRRTNDKLRMLDETKDEFISMASHQLRTPLTSVKGYLSMVLDGDAGKITAQQRKLLDQAFISSQRMVYLIADLLNVSRLRTGKFVIDRQPTNLSEVVHGEVEQLKETAAARDLKLSFKKPKEFPDLMLDETKIRQVVMNFIDNAIYYTPAGGSIEVELVDKPDSVEYRVKDTGIGVPKAERHKLFTKFFRAPNAKKARPDGTGLGLFMAKKVIVAQGGSVIFESQEGKGSTFGFSFAKSPQLTVTSPRKTLETSQTS